MQNNNYRSLGKRIFAKINSGTRPIGLKDHLRFTASSMLILMLMYSLLRLALLVYNREQIGGATAGAGIALFGRAEDLVVAQVVAAAPGRAEDLVIAQIVAHAHALPV